MSVHLHRQIMDDKKIEEGGINRPRYGSFSSQEDLIKREYQPGIGGLKPYVGDLFQVMN